MIEYIKAGERNLKFYFEQGYPDLDSKQERAIDRYWQAAFSRNQTLQNNPIYSCHRVNDNGGTARFYLNETDYCIYKWARDNNVAVAGAYAMGNCMFIFDPGKGEYVFVQRSSTVSFDKAKISGVGGVIDYKNVNMNFFSSYVKHQAEKEAREELHIFGQLEAVAFLGLYWDDQTCKVEFAYSGEAQVLGVKAKENKKLLTVKPSELRSFVGQHSGQFEESNKNHLDNMIQSLVALHT